MKTLLSRRRFRLVEKATMIMVVGILLPNSVSAALTEACLTGTALDVLNDPSQIRNVRHLVDSACVCSNFDGSKRHAHADYVKCARKIISAQVPGSLRRQCAATVRKFYAQSMCGTNPNLHDEPCIQTTLNTGKITCTIKPTTKKDGVTLTNACSDTPGKVTRVACSGYTRCIDAADNSGNLIIAAPGDNGTCAPSESLVWGPIAVFSWQNGNTISTVASDGSGEILSLEWIPVGGFVELVVTFPGLLPVNALQLEGTPPSLQIANIVAGVIVGLNAAPLVPSFSSNSSVIPRTTGNTRAGNKAGCDSIASPLTCTDGGGCCVDHDACFVVSCKGPNDSGDVGNCLGATARNRTCVELCTQRGLPLAICQAGCDVGSPTCSPQCQQCHDAVINCVRTKTPGPAKCCADGDCGMLQQCIVNGKVITDPCVCQANGQPSVDPCQQPAASPTPPPPVATDTPPPAATDTPVPAPTGTLSCQETSVPQCGGACFGGPLSVPSRCVEVHDIVNIGQFISYCNCMPLTTECWSVDVGDQTISGYFSSVFFYIYCNSPAYQCVPFPCPE